MKTLNTVFAITRQIKRASVIPAATLLGLGLLIAIAPAAKAHNTPGSPHDHTPPPPATNQRQSGSGWRRPAGNFYPQL